MESVNLDNIIPGSNVTVTTTETYRVNTDGTKQADVSVRKTTNGLAGQLKSEEKLENFSYTGTSADLKSAVDSNHTVSHLTTNTGV
jgi:hypothetical protein